ncbi:MAG: hypothetical protein KF850_03490 [Labilithrix sp.]|nr:hypothetical protein [Labilithrix sp.]
MNHSRRRLAILIAGAVCASAAVVACSSDDTRPSFDAPDGGGANLPDAGPGQDANAPGDAGPTKPPFDPADEPIVCAGTPCAVELVAGEHHFCARMSDGSVRCWGDNAYGSLGVEEAPASEGSDGGVLAARVTDLAGATQLSAGGATTCALTGDAGIVCWGGNEHGQLGLTVSPPTVDGDPHATPAPVALAASALRVDVGQRTACATLTSGDAHCWGDNAQKQLARTTEDDVGGPAKAELGELAVRRTAAGTGSSFAITDAGLVSWGALGGPEGVVAARVASVSPDPHPLAVLQGPVSSLSVGSTRLYSPPGGGFPRPPPQGIAHACAIVSGEVFCWGASLMGALGTGLPEPSSTPLVALVASEEAWPQQVACAGDVSCVRLTDGSVQCAGDNTTGVLGKEPETDPFSMFFAPVPSFTGHAARIATSVATACALVQGGTVVCWGSNERGELGQGTADADPHTKPISIRF